MDVIDRRMIMGRVLAQMAQGGKTLPACMDVVSYTASQTARYHTIQHNLGKVPSMFIIIPKVEETRTGNTNTYAITGFTMGSSGVADYPNKLIRNFKTSSGNWDYSGNGTGWKADTNEITIDAGTAYQNTIKARDYWVYIFTYA